MSARPNESAPPHGTTGRGGRLVIDWAFADFSAASTAAQLLAARHCLTIERAALVAVLALGGAHGR